MTSTPLDGEAVAPTTLPSEPPATRRKRRQSEGTTRDGRQRHRPDCLWGLSAHEVLRKDPTQRFPETHNRGGTSSLTPSKFRTALCKHATAAPPHCCYGIMCWMAHTPSQSRTIDQNKQDGLTTVEAVRAFQLRELERAAETPGDVVCSSRSAASGSGEPAPTAVSP